MSFPDDADGDVLRRLEESGFDFSVPQSVEFNVDFGSWPPPKEALEKLQSKFQRIEVFEPEDEFDGYIIFTLHEIITYDLVVGIQNQVTDLMSGYGGICESWGVFN